MSTPSEVVGALNGLTATEQYMIAEGDTVAVRYLIEATGSGELFGIPGHRPPDPLGADELVPPSRGQDRQRGDLRRPGVGSPRRRQDRRDQRVHSFVLSFIGATVSDKGHLRPFLGSADSLISADHDNAVAATAVADLTSASHIPSIAATSRQVKVRTQWAGRVLPVVGIVPAWTCTPLTLSRHSPSAQPGSSGHGISIRDLGAQPRRSPTVAISSDRAFVRLRSLIRCRPQAPGTG